MEEVASEKSPFDLGRFRAQVAWLADRGIYVGTSSWNYEGWLGQIYDANRYLTRGKFSGAKFERDCLREYAETFRTVCFDGGYYSFPTEKKLQELSDQVPDNFRFAFKVPDEITIRRFPNLAKHGPRAATKNPSFLNAELFLERFLKPAEQILGRKLGPIIFQFTKMQAQDYPRGELFLEDLERFFSALPSGRPYSVELRNRTWLQDDYLASLKKHGVAHVFNNWTDMPSAGEQLGIVADRRIEDRTVARFLLKPGRSYEEAKSTFQPYKITQDANPEARDAIRKLVEMGALKKQQDGTYIYINNRLEGNAINTVAALMQMLKEMGLIPELPPHLIRHLPMEIPDPPADDPSAQLQLGL